MSSGIEILPVRRARSREGREFIALPFSLYAGNRCWVPWFSADLRQLIDRRHPFFEHSGGEFLLARRQGRPCGRIAVLENRRYNEAHGIRSAHFYFFDAANDREVASALFTAAFDWARARGLDQVIGPLGIGGTSGGGILVEGFDARAAMTMMAYNHAYYRELVEAAGFTKLLDLNSFYLDADTFRLPDKVRSIAEKVLARGSFKVLEFSSRRPLKAIAGKVGKVYNSALGDHVETYSLSDREVRKVTQDLMTVADPTLIKVLTYNDEVVGFLFGFPDLSEAIRRARGRLNPITILDLLREYKRTDWLIANGAGILPKYQRLGGNALLYYELERTAKQGGRFRHVDLTQIAETTGLMLKDVETLGGRVYKVHRLYTRSL